MCWGAGHQDCQHTDMHDGEDRSQDLAPSDEFIAPTASQLDKKVLASTLESGTDAASRIGLELGQYWNSRLATAAALKAIDVGAGGGFFHVPDEALLDPVSYTHLTLPTILLV